jgi:hypothetical protein
MGIVILLGNAQAHTSGLRCDRPNARRLTRRSNSCSRWGEVRYRELFLRMLESLAVPAGYDRAGILAKLEGIRQEKLPGVAVTEIWLLIPFTASAVE